MTPSVTELMDQVLSVFGERDGATRRAAIDAAFAEDVTFADAEGVRHGREALDETVAGLLSGMPEEFVFAADGPVRVVADLGFRSWTLGPPGGPAVTAGTDVITVRDGRITALWTALDEPVAGA